ncbi:MAG TPA: hypothetical protein PKC28_15870, partial [Bdellovibrionales bacterium]|nr:hypothetical protein [Bdellovibrionales bacterium]
RRNSYASVLEISGSLTPSGIKSHFGLSLEEGLLMLELYLGNYTLVLKVGKLRQSVTTTCLRLRGDFTGV